MSRRVFVRIVDRSDGQFDAIVTIEPAEILRRDGFVSLAEAEEWVGGLRVIMAALGAPVAHAGESGSDPMSPEAAEPTPNEVDAEQPIQED